MLLWMLPLRLFEAFDEVIILTYLFEAQPLHLSLIHICVGSYQWVLDAGTDKINIRKAFHYIRPIV